MSWQKQVFLGQKVEREYEVHGEHRWVRWLLACLTNGVLQVPDDHV